MSPVSAPYVPVNQLFLWYLADPTSPVLIGTLNLVMNGRGVSLSYAESWLRYGFALSEDLPLMTREHPPRARDHAAGAVQDARPDRWGERVIRHLERPPRLSLLELLFFAGDERAGALGVSSSASAYLPCHRGPLPTLADADELHGLVLSVIAGEPIDERKRRLMRPGTLGGARPKALIDLDGEPWILKFADGDDTRHEPLIEHATMTLAARAGIAVAETRPITTGLGTAVAVRRFDRDAGQRRHVISAHVALGAAGSELAYPALAQLLRRRGEPAQGLARQQMRELFRRMVFNILIDNTDDHEKNHALLMTDRQTYQLSPAYDVLPAGTALGYQSLGVGAAGAEASLHNALTQPAAFGLSREEAVQEAARVAGVVAQWARHFAESGVPHAEITRLAHSIDRPDLQRQRAEILAQAQAV